MMPKYIIALLISGLAYLSVAEAAEYRQVQIEKSALRFVYKQMGVPVGGSFNKFTVQLRFDPAQPSLAKVILDLDMSSIDAGSDEANDEVSAKPWFNTKAYPQAKFESTSFKALGGNKYEVSGKMQIKGRSRIVTAAFTFNPQVDSAVVDGAFTLKRADFAIGEGVWADYATVANEIQIKFHFIANAGK
jgi:polyisoprenoid-binding protein YceI